MSEWQPGGAAVIDITPPAGLKMTGYVARTEAAIGAHDALTVRAVVYGEYAIVVADVIGIHESTSLCVRTRACLPADNIIVAALHNHGAPASMPGRLGYPSDQRADQAFLDALEQACVDAIDDAVASAQPCRLRAGFGQPPGVAMNRRHRDGPVNDSLPVFELVDELNKIIATIVSYACHPVVLGADNLYYTADYPHYVRSSLERREPGSVALFITGAAADANTGHSASESVTLVANSKRTYAEAQRIGEHIAHCAGKAVMVDAGVDASMANCKVTLASQRRELEPAAALSVIWQREFRTAEGAQADLLKCWINWAEKIATESVQPLDVRVSVMNWGGFLFVALPGEIFASTAHAIQLLVSEPHIDAGNSFSIVGYADTNPGYIPPESEFAYGGYEVDEAHRYYGRPATFAPDSVERLLQAVTNCLPQA